MRVIGFAVHFLRGIETIGECETWSVKNQFDYATDIAVRVGTDL